MKEKAMNNQATQAIREIVTAGKTFNLRDYDWIKARFEGFPRYKARFMIVTPDSVSSPLTFVKAKREVLARVNSNTLAGLLVFLPSGELIIERA